MAKRKPVRLDWPMDSFAGSTVFEMPAARSCAQVPVGFRLPIDGAFAQLRADIAVSRERMREEWMREEWMRLGLDPRGGP